MGDNNKEKVPMSPRNTHGFSFDGDVMKTTTHNVLYLTTVLFAGFQYGMASAMKDIPPGVNEGVDRRRNSIGENSQVTMDR